MLPKCPALGVKLCPRCGKQFNVRGYGMHQKACKEPDGPIPVIDADSINPEPSKDESRVEEVVSRPWYVEYLDDHRIRNEMVDRDTI